MELAGRCVPFAGARLPHRGLFQLQTGMTGFDRAGKLAVASRAAGMLAR